MKKFAKILSVLVLVLALSSVAFASDGEYHFSVSVDNSTVKVGDTVTVTMTMSRKDGASYDLYGMQDYTRFESEYLQFVEGSIKVATTTSNGYTTDMFEASAIKDLTTKVPHSVYVNRTETTPYVTKENEDIEVVTFELKAVQKGTTEISQYGMEMLTQLADPLPVLKNALDVVITDGSTGGNPGGDTKPPVVTPPAEKPSVVTPPVTEKFLFDDVRDESKYYFDPVYWAVDHDITTGITPTLFMPDAVCTRAQAVTFLWRSAGMPKTNSINPFTDVSQNSYYYDAVLWAVAKGITNGTSATTFAPDLTCSRAHIVTFLGRFAKASVASGANPFTDVKSTDYFYDFVAWAADHDITKGTSNTTFSPNNSCKRAEIVTFIYRYSET